MSTNINLTGGSLTLLRQPTATPSAHGQLDFQNVNGSMAIVNDQGTTLATGAAISVDTPTALAALSVAGLSSGQQALVKAVRTSGAPGIYVLQAALSSTPDNFYVVATADDTARQWVQSILAEQAFIAPITAELDFTQTQTVVVLPPLPFILWESLAVSAIVTVAGGTVTTAPTIKVGTDATFTNMLPATLQTAALGGTPTVGARISLTGLVAANAMSLATNGLKVVVTVAATLGTAPALKGRIVFSMGLYN